MPITVRILDAAVEFMRQRFVTPLQLSSGTIHAITQATASVRVEVGGAQAIGRGTVYLSDLWAWPDPSLSHDAKDAALRCFCEDIARDLFAMAGGVVAHPLTLGLRLHDHVCSAAGGQTPVIPTLAAAMALSPFDAAIHDATGHALGISAFGFYDESFGCPESDGLFADGSTQHAIKRALLATRRTALDAWLVVGKNDELPGSLLAWIGPRGYRCFKLKTLGQGAGDADRVIAVFNALRTADVARPRLCVDSNEADPDAQSVEDFLLRIKRDCRPAFDALEYLEQPTSRDILRHPQDWSRVSAMRPVFLDEGLTGLELLAEAKRQHWSGLALKACKGHSFALVAAAWAVENKMLLTMQDLTSPGLSLIHSALLASRLPTINGVELNSPQFTPDANVAWLPALAPLITPSDGMHRLPVREPIGLGSSIQP